MFGFAVLLAVAPFHSWVPALAEHAPPLAAVFVFTVIRQTVLFLLLAFLSNFDWLNQNPAVYRALTLAGGGMVLFGAVFVFGQRNFGRMLGYVVLIDFGAVMLGLGLGTQSGVESALITSVLRGIALPFWAAGVVRLRQAGGSDQFDALRGVGRREPVAAAAVILSLLSLGGFSADCRIYRPLGIAEPVGSNSPNRRHPAFDWHGKCGVRLRPRPGLSVVAPGARRRARAPAILAASTPASYPRVYPHTGVRVVSTVVAAGRGGNCRGLQPAAAPKRLAQPGMDRIQPRQVRYPTHNRADKVAAVRP